METGGDRQEAGLPWSPVPHMPCHPMIEEGRPGCAVGPGGRHPLKSPLFAVSDPESGSRSIRDPDVVSPQKGGGWCLGLNTVARFGHPCDRRPSRLSKCGGRGRTRAWNAGGDDSGHFLALGLPRSPNHGCGEPLPSRSVHQRCAAYLAWFRDSGIRVGACPPSAGRTPLEQA